MIGRPLIMPSMMRRPFTREQVVGERVIRGEALGHREDEEDEADDPVELAGLAERTGEEDAQHVHADTGHEHECRPVVDLADQETTAQGRTRCGSADSIAADIAMPRMGS